MIIGSLGVSFWFEILNFLKHLYKNLLIRGSFGINAILTADVLVMKIVHGAIINVVLVLVMCVIVMQCAEVGGLTETQ